MKAMRAGTKPLMWIVVAAFVGTIVFAWGMDFTGRPAQRGIVGEVNGVELKTDEYLLRLQNIYQQRQQQGGEVTEEEARTLRDNTFNQMVNSYLLTEVVMDKNLQVTNKEVAEHLKRVPPREVQNVEIFMTDGQFDYNKYLQAYQNPDPQLWIQIEALARPQVLQQKLFEYVISTARVNDSEVRELYDAASEKVKVRYLFVGSAVYRDSITAIDSTQTKAYFSSHPDEFAHLERVKLRSVSFAKKPSRLDSLDVKNEMAELARRAREGDDFGQLAREYSDDGSASAGGDLGWFGKGAMVPDFETAAFALDSGAVSDPIATQYGYHIIKCEGRRGIGDSVQVKASHILMRIDISAATQSDVRLQAEQFVEDARAIGFDSAAVAGNQSIASSGWYEKGSERGAGSDPLVSEWSFGNAPGAVSDAFDNARTYVVWHLDDRQPAGRSTFDEIESRIRSKLTTEARMKRAQDVLTPIQPRVAAGLSLADAAAEVGQPVDSTDFFGRFDFVTRFGEDPNFRGAAFALTNEAPLSPVVKTDYGAGILELIDRQEPDLQLFAEKRDSIHTATMEGKRQMVYNNWFNELRANADIRDYRYQVPGGY
jgi:parvulin-like peptidyl-prolyl isomerase